MKFVLILITSMFSAGEQVNVATAEFDDQYSCQQAGRRAEQLWNQATSTAAKRIAWDCVPKGAK